MSSARDAILTKLKQSRQITPNTTPPGEYHRQAWTGEEKIDRFSQIMQSVKGEVHRVSATNWVEKTKQLCHEKAVKNLLHGTNPAITDALQSGWNGDTSLPELICRSESVDEWKEDIFFHTDAAITSVKCGIADTGTLILWPTPEEPRTYSLVPGIHFALLHADSLYDTFADVIEQERWHSGLPTNVLLISGPSKSADIEQNLVYGVHGPMQLITLLITDD